ncbi:MAG: NYN domain-containing protein [Zoogloeaceae bacterium]|jgi:uncharacterized protein (TIGR00288 family)|nr:NYN domain-containing protein [Zoogloeaceae bacterium]
MKDTDNTEPRTAVLIDCDNVSPEILEYALRIAAQSGRIVIRRGYGNLNTLSNKWQEAMVRQAFTPRLQYQYASGKNTSDIAMALDAQETLFDKRADTFCLVTSDSDFTYLCRKLRERGAMVCLVGEAKTPQPLRNACDQFFEWKPETRTQTTAKPQPTTEPKARATGKSATASSRASKTPSTKECPHSVVDAVTQLVSEPSSEGEVSLGALGQYLRRIDPGFSPKNHGHASLLNMLKTSNLLTIRHADSMHWVALAEQARKKPSPVAAQDTSSQ